MKTVGIIGGLGPETTAKFYLELVNRCGKIDLTNRPPILIWNVPVNKVEEDKLLLQAEAGKTFLPLLVNSAQRLEKSGADFLIMPCNSLHFFIKEIKESVGIPVLNIIERTVAEIKSQDIKRVGY